MKKVAFKFDKKNRFTAMFNTETGFYIRSGVLDENGKDTGVDPFMAEYPELLDVGVMGHCIHGVRGLCAKSGVQCYQNGLGIKNANMSLEDFQSIVDQIKGKTFQLALGGRGDVNKHEQFEEIVKYCRDNNIVPNYTTSGLDLTDEEVRITKQYCGAVAVSFYDKDPNGYTYSAINKFVDAGITTNIHYVLGNNSIDDAIERLKNDNFPKGINAVVFLLHKPVGLGQSANVLQFGDRRIGEFFYLIDNSKVSFEIGFDSCTVCGLINYTTNIDMNSLDTCEGARFSAYITSDMKMLPCSFDNQDMFFAVDLKTNSIEDAWNSDNFERFRGSLRNSCPNCKNRANCMGGCPLQRSIVLCEKDEKDLK